MKYLIEIHHGIGDVVQMTGVIETIYNQEPNRQIDIIVYAQNRADILKNDPRVTNIFFLNLKDNPKRETLKTLLALRKNRYDYALYSPISNIRSTNILSRLIGARISIGEQFANNTNKYKHIEKEETHIVKRNANLLLKSGLADSVSEPVLKGIRDNAEMTNSIGLCIGTSKPVKTWPLDRYLEIANHFEEKGYNVLFLGGNAERESFPLDEFTVHRGWRDYLGKLDIIGTTTLTKACDVVVGGDTGVLHLAAAVGTPTVSLFSCSDPALHAPYSDVSYVVTHKTDCQYCYESGGFVTCPEYRCLNGISTDVVLHVVEKVLDGLYEDIKEYKFAK